MAWDAAMTEKRDRVRFALADTADPPALPGGEDAYDVVLATVGDDEVAAWRAAAGVLEGVFARRAASLSSAGESISFAAERVQFYRNINRGGVSYPLTKGGAASAPQGGHSRVEVTW
jgi:hypothetical protein